MSYDNKSININHYEIKDFENFLVLKSFIVSVGDNRKKTNFSKEAIKDAIPTLYNRPVYCKWYDRLDDFGGHAKRESDVMNDDYFFIGHIPADGEIKFEEYNGKEFLTATTLIYKDYFSEICNRIIEEQPELSMEVSIDEAFENDEGMLEISKFRFLSYVLLGRYNKPGIESAHVEVLQFEEDDLINEYNIKYQNSVPKYDVPEDISNIIKENIRKKEANIDLDFAKSLLGKKQLAFNEVVAFLNNVVNADSDSEINFLGGESAIDWCKQIIALSKGGEEILSDNKDELEKVEDNIQEEQIDEAQVDDEEKFSVGSLAPLLSQVIDDKDGYLWYEDCDPEKKYVYYFDFERYKYFAAPYAFAGELPVVDYDNAIRAYYGGIKWVLEKGDNVQLFEDSDYPLAINYVIGVTKQMKSIKEDFESVSDELNNLKESYDSLKVERDSLAEFKAGVEKEKEDKALLSIANEKYQDFDKYLTEDMIAKFDEQILEHRNIEKLEGDIAKAVLPILMGIKEEKDTKSGISFSMSDDVTEDKKDEDDTESFDEILKKKYKN